MEEISSVSLFYISNSIKECCIQNNVPDMLTVEMMRLCSKGRVLVQNDAIVSEMMSSHLKQCGCV